MAVEKFEARHALVFNFTQYTGGIERELCAYIIGAIGDCGVGEEMVELYDKDHPEGTEFWGLSDRTVGETDDNGCARPTSIYHDVGVDEKPNHSTIIFLGTLPTDEEMAMILARTKDFCQNRPDQDQEWRTGEKVPLTLKGVKLISNKVQRVIKTEKVYDIS